MPRLPVQVPSTVRAALTPASSPEAAQTTTQADWSTQDSLPLLKCVLIRPIKSPERFAVDALSVDFPKDKSMLPVTGPPGEPFARNEDAVAAARAWIVEYFGQLPDGIELRLRNVHSPGVGK